MILNIKILDTLPTQPTCNIRSLHHLLTTRLLLSQLFKRIPDMVEAPLAMAGDTADCWDGCMGSIDGDAGEDGGLSGEGVASAVVDEEGFEGVEGFEKPGWVELLTVWVGGKTVKCGGSAAESKVLDAVQVVFDAGQFGGPSGGVWLVSRSRLQQFERNNHGCEGLEA